MKTVKRYVIQARRKSGNREWSEWTLTDDLDEALRHAKRVIKFGFDVKIVDKGETDEQREAD